MVTHEKCLHVCSTLLLCKALLTQHTFNPNYISSIKQRLDFDLVILNIQVGREVGLQGTGFMRGHHNEIITNKNVYTNENVLVSPKVKS